MIALQFLFSLTAVTPIYQVQGRRQVKQIGVDCPPPLCLTWRGVSPPKPGGRVCGYNLKLISTLHNDSIPETPSGKKWGGRVHPSPPRCNAPAIYHLDCVKQRERKHPTGLRNGH